MTDKGCSCGDPVPEDKFVTELQALLNKYSKENGSNTTDFVLADYLNTCLKTFDYYTRYRDEVKTSSLVEYSAE